MREICLNEDVLFNEIIRPCRKGQFIYVICDSEKILLLFRKMLRAHVPDYRGIFTWKGIVVSSTVRAESFNDYFDEILIIKENQVGTKSVNKKRNKGRTIKSASN